MMSEYDKGDYDEIEYSINRIASAITPACAGSSDETGVHIESLTEAVMGVTAGLCRIAESIGDLAEAAREK